MTNFSSPVTISYAYKVGVKREMVQALRDAVNSWPDLNFRGKVKVVNEWPLTEIDYPMIVLHFAEESIENIGIGHYEVAFDDSGTPYKLLHWMFKGQLTFTVYANTPLDRDMISVGILNLIAFGKEIPEFENFHKEVTDNDFVALQMLTDKIIPGGDGVTAPPWGNPDDNIFTASYGVQLLGEFFTDPRTSNLVMINQVIAYPYRKDQPIPQGSQAHDSEHDDRTVPWIP